MTSVPNNWILASLDEFGEWGSGGTPKRTIARYYHGGTIPWLIIGDLNDGVVNSAATYITDEGLRNSSAKLLPVDTILIAMYGSIGKLGITGVECATNQAIAFCKPNKNINLKYLFYSLMNVRDDLITYGQGGAQQNISQTILRAYKIPLAPHNEQKRIADKLDSLMARVDACREHLERVPGILKRFRQAVLAAAVSGRLTEEWRNSQKLSLSWDAILFEHILAKEDGSIRRGPFGSAIKKSFFVPRGYKVYEQKNAIQDDPNLGEYFIDENKFQELQAFEVKPGDFIVSCAGTIGRISKIPQTAQPGVINQALMRIRLNNDKITDDFFVLLFRSPNFQKRILDETQGTAMQNMASISTIKQLVVDIPTIPEQNEVVKRVASLFGLADKLEAHFQATRSRFDSLTPALLAKAFRGELVPQDPNDEPASVLLERIRVEKAKQAEEPRRVGKRQPREDKMTGDSVKEIIQKLPQDNFSFDELREKLSGDYDEIKNILFNLLAEPNPQIKQVFDTTTQTIRFIRIDR